MLPNLAWTLTPVTLVLGEHKPGENDGDFGRNEVLKERGEEIHNKRGRTTTVVL